MREIALYTSIRFFYTPQSYGVQREYKQNGTLIFSDNNSVDGFRSSVPERLRPPPDDNPF